MFDDIVKALTIKVTADDLTGGTWSKIGDGVKTVWNNVTALNQAWELTSKVFGKVEQIAAQIGKGGELAEATAGLTGLAESFGFQQDGKGLLQILDNFAEGELNIIELTNKTGDAIRRNFSESQLTTIYAFSRKFADTTGASFIQTAETIEKALATGVYKPLKDILGETIAKGATASDILARLAQKTEEMGPGAFNLADAFRLVTSTASDMSIEVMRAVNDMIGESGFEGLAQSVRASFWEIRDDIPWVIKGIWEPTKDLISGVQLYASDFFALFFDQTDSMRDVVYALTKTLGGMIYDVKWLAVAAIEAVASPFVALLDKVVRLEMYLQELTGTSSESSRQINSDFLNDLEAMKTLTKTVEDDKKAWEERTDAAREAASEDKINWAAAGNAVKEYGKELLGSVDFLWSWADGEEEVAKKTEKATKTTEKATTVNKDAVKVSKELSDETKELAKTYDSLGKSFEGTIKTMGDVVNKTQEGINSTAGGLVDYIKTADMFTFGSSQKKSQIEAVMEDLQQQKSEEMRVLEKSADAQIELAKAYTQFANTPRKIEHTATGSAREILLSLVTSVIETIEKLSLEENTPVAGVA